MLNIWCFPKATVVMQSASMLCCTYIACLIFLVVYGFPICCFTQLPGSFNLVALDVVRWEFWLFSGLRHRLQNFHQENFFFLFMGKNYFYKICVVFECLLLRKIPEAHIEYCFLQKILHHVHINAINVTKLWSTVVMCSLVAFLLPSFINIWHPVKNLLGGNTQRWMNMWTWWYHESVFPLK